MGLQAARKLIEAASAIVVLTGAGISTDSGIPDFRGPQGLWTKDPAAEKMASIEHYVADPEVRRRSWRNRLASPAWTAIPNPGHSALVSLEQQGKLHTLITQNIDELHLQAGTEPGRLIQVHGTMRRFVCMSCEAGGPMEEALSRVKKGEDDPPCLDCGGILKSATISFGQPLVRRDLERAFAAARSCDLLLAVGTSLAVRPIADVVPIALRHGSRLVIVNGEPTPYDGVADAVLRGQISAVLPALVAV